MAKHPLININGHFVESDFENALISFLENEGWQYLYGDTIPRSNKKEVLYMDDLIQFLEKKNPELEDDEIRQIADNIRLVGSDSDFATLHKVYLLYIQVARTYHIPILLNGQITDSFNLL